MSTLFNLSIIVVLYEGERSRWFQRTAVQSYFRTILPTATELPVGWGTRKLGGLGSVCCVFAPSVPCVTPVSVHDVRAILVWAPAWIKGQRPRILSAADLNAPPASTQPP